MATKKKAEKSAEEASSKEEEVKSEESENVAEGEGSEEKPETKAASEDFEPLSYIDSLELDDAKKEALKGGYLRQSDYTKKTQELAKERKLIERWNPVIERLNQDPNLFNVVMGYQRQPGQAQATQEETIPDDPKEFMKLAEERGAKRALQQMREEMTQREDYQRAEKVDPRLSTDENFASAVVGKISQDTEYLSGRKTAEQATRDAVLWVDNYVKGVKSATKKELTEKVRNKTMVTPKTSSPVSTEKSQPKSIHEAYKQAYEELSS